MGVFTEDDEDNPDRLKIRILPVIRDGEDVVLAREVFERPMIYWRKVLERWGIDQPEPISPEAT
jgi:hypothetical protein